MKKILSIIVGVCLYFSLSAQIPNGYTKVAQSYYWPKYESYKIQSFKSVKQARKKIKNPQNGTIVLVKDELFIYLNKWGKLSR